jgi:hypothetical protein
MRADSAVEPTRSENITVTWRRSQSLQASSHIHCVAENRHTGVGTSLHTANYRDDGVKAEAKLGLDTVFCSEFSSIGVQFLQDRQRRATSTQRRILERDWRAEHRHDAVAGKALDYPTLLAHSLVHQFREAPHKGKGGFLPRPFRERREAHHVGEKDRDLPALTALRK